MLRFFARRLSDAQNEEKGFTLVELLVVIIIIGILAAIAIPAFLNQRQQANQAACRSDVRNGAAAANAYAADQPDGSYTGMTLGILTAAPYNWNLTTPPSEAAPTVTVTGGGTGFTIANDCTNAPAATYNFDSATGTVTP